MTFGQAVRTVFSKYATFSGRAPRSEFWWWALFTWLGNIVLSMVDSMLFGTVEVVPGAFSAHTSTPIFSSIFALVTLLPSLAVAVRRLHDTDHSSWWLLLWFIPVVGWIVLLVWFVTEGSRGDNRFGPDPLAHMAGHVADGGPIH